MRIDFYHNVDDSKVVNKQITLLGQIEGRLTSIVDVRNPTITINGEIPLDANYAYIEQFERYYYISSIDIQYNKLPMVTFSCDVLMTFKDEILNSIGHFTQNTHYNPFSASYDVSSQKHITVIDFDGFAFPAYPTMVLVTSKSNHADWYHGSLG